MILDEIIKNRIKLLEIEKRKVTPDQMRKKALEVRHTTKDFGGALKQKHTAVLSEVKKASPSKGLIKADFDPVLIAKEYEAEGADAISVLTEERYFMGSAAYLEAIRKAVNLPLLRKDFIIDSYQIYEARLLGADAILLIAAALPADKLKEFIILAGNLGLQCLVETHNENEVKAALTARANIIGVNNRDLRTFQVDLSVSERLLGFLPEENAGKQVIKVAESGIVSAVDVKRMREAGADAVLIGETLMRAQSVGQKLMELKLGKKYGSN